MLFRQTTEYKLYLRKLKSKTVKCIKIPLITVLCVFAAENAESQELSPLALSFNRFSNEHSDKPLLSNANLSVNFPYYHDSTFVALVGLNIRYYNYQLPEDSLMNSHSFYAFSIPFKSILKLSENKILTVLFEPCLSSDMKGISNDDFQFKLLELEEEYNEDIAEKQARYDAALKVVEDKEAEKAKPTAAQIKALKSAKASLDKLTAEKEGKEITAQEQAEKESKAIDAVEIELITMLQDPELRKRYFSVVEMEELEENEFNLNIPRYVDTFEPEEEINLAQAIEEFKTVLKTEENIHQKLQNLLVF